MYLEAIDKIKAITYELMLGCENFGEFQYIRFISTYILGEVITDLSNGEKTNWVKLFDDINTKLVCTGIDPKLEQLMEEYKISIMDLFKDIEEAYERNKIGY